MKSLRAFFVRLSGWFRKRERERDMMEEFESHLQMHIADNMQSGLSPEEARRQALLKFGGLEVAKESMRDRARFLWLETTWLDMRYALRGLHRNPGFAATAILSLALGIGASMAIFTVADNLLLRPLPYPNASQLVMVWESNSFQHLPHNVTSPANYLDWKAQNTVFSEMAGFFDDYHVVFSDGRRTEEVDSQIVTSELLPMLGVPPYRGRFFTKEEDARDAQVVIISYRLWQSWFGGDEGVIGRKVQINSRPFTIIGVLAPNFYFHKRSADLWLTLGLNPAEDLRKTQGRWLLVVARLKPGTSLRQAQTEMTGIAQRLTSAYPAFNAGWSVALESFRDSLVTEVKTSLLVLLGAVTLLLAVACANVANLLLARYTARRREIAVRGALGAGRWRIVRQLLAESLVLALIGGLLGVVMARFTVTGLVNLAPKDLTRFTEISFDLRVLFVALALSVLTSVVFGLLPAIDASRSDVRMATNENSAASVGDNSRLRRWLVVGEVAASVALLAGAGLLFRSLIGLQAVDPGLNASNVLTFRVSLPHVHYPQPEQSIRFFQQASEKIARIPGTQSVSAISYLPFNGMAAGTGVTIQGAPPQKPGEGLVTIVRTVLPGYFHVMGIPILQGRDFNAADNVGTSPMRFVVNQAFVEKYLANERPLEKSISVDMDPKGNPFGQIIGVVGDVKEGELAKEPVPTVYYVHAHLPYTVMVFVLRANSPLALAGPARKAIQEIDAEEPIADVRTMEEVLGETLGRQRFSAVLLAGFSLTSVVLAAVGIYGVLAYSVSQRTREIGVRVALGAEPGRILRLIVGGGARLVLAGAAIGVASALALSGVLKSLLFGISPRDPLSFILAPLLLIVVALIAAYLPARRASLLAPMEALRTE